ncbi:hypothetical protein DL93DRAFT_2169297 [Clavulina sp. PMI_390]|nr:hypothetical protein DL93DRAFT_2169297 [Clavulina sp. PMI_390]
MPRLATSKFVPLALIVLLGFGFLYRRSSFYHPNQSRYPPRVHGLAADEHYLGLPLAAKPGPPLDVEPVVKPQLKNPLAESMPLNKQDTLAALQPLLVERSDARHEGYIGGQAPREEADKFMAKHNRRVLEALVDCVFAATCTHFQTKLVILDAFIFPHARDLLPKRDDYYSHSALKSLDSLGASYVFSNVNTTWAIEIHKLFPSLVHAVIFQEGDHIYQLSSCFASAITTNDADPESDIKNGCVQIPGRFPHGIPAHKLFGWGTDGWLTADFPGSPLGTAWTLVNEPFSQGQTYIGYSIQEQCEASGPDRLFPSIPAAARPKDPHHHAFIHANLETYFWLHHNDWKPSWFDRAVAATGVQAYAALDPEVARLRDYPITKGVWVVPKTLVELDRRKMSETDILTEMAKASIFVGLWDPLNMVQPYIALCMGVPFLNPIHSHNSEHPEDRSAWVVQNAALKWVDAPYVYNVFKTDEQGFQDALRGSVEKTFDSYIPPSMTTAAVRTRWAKFLDTNWLEKAELESPPAELERFGLARQGVPK